MLATDSRHLQRSTRRLAVRAAVAEWFRRKTWPRLTIGMSLLISVAVAWGLSAGLRLLGVTAMWLRYPVALGVGYLTFLVILKWLIVRAANQLNRERVGLLKDSVRQQRRSHEGDQLDLGEVLDAVGEVAEQSQRHIADPRMLPVWATAGLAATIVLVLVYYTWAAPLLLSELVVEGGLAPWIYRPISRGPFSTWRDVALELTGPAAAVMAFCLLGLCFVFAGFAPQATDIVEVWDHVLELRELALRNQGGAR